MASGDIFLATVAMFFDYISIFYAGVKLQTTREKGAEVIKFMQGKKVVVLLIPTQYIQDSVLNLMGICDEPKYSSADEESILATNNSVLTTLYFRKAYTSFMFRLYDGMKANTEKFLACIAHASTLLVSQSFRTFYIGLVSFWAARTQEMENNGMREATNPKEAFCNGNFDDAKVYYEKAVTSAKSHKFVHEEALACELAAYFYLEIGEGAMGKCTSLFKYFGGVMNKECVDPSPADSLAIAIQSEEAHLQSEDSLRNAEVRKRRIDIDDHALAF
eukprot:scaffold7550_cov100-Skeletonema_menzelii.AAC.2